MVNDEVWVAKHHHDFEEVNGVRIDEAELDRDASGPALPSEDCREMLLARFLSQSEGFALAGRSLGGSFAGGRSFKGVKRN